MTSEYAQILEEYPHITNYKKVLLDYYSDHIKFENNALTKLTDLYDKLWNTRNELFQGPIFALLKSILFSSEQNNHPCDQIIIRIPTFEVDLTRRQVLTLVSDTLTSCYDIIKYPGKLTIKIDILSQNIYFSPTIPCECKTIKN